MSQYLKLIICLFITTILLTTGCSQDSSNEEEKNIDAAPEQVLRNFFVANLNPDENTIRSLIVDHKDAAILWLPGNYPKEVEEMLTAQYKQMDIVRVGEAGNETDKVLLKSSASPTPIHVINVNGTWKVDASPIIEFRLMAQKN